MCADNRVSDRQVMGGGEKSEERRARSVCADNRVSDRQVMGGGEKSEECVLIIAGIGGR